MKYKKTSTEPSFFSIIASIIIGYYFQTKTILSVLNELEIQEQSDEKKIMIAFDSLIEASRLISDLEKNLKLKAENLEKVKIQFEEYSKLAKVEKEKAEPILEKLNDLVSRGKKRERWISLLINLIAGLIIFGVGFIVGNVL